AMQARLDRDLELGADPVGGRDQNRIGEPRGLEVEQATKAADLGVGSRAGGGAHQRLDHVDQAIAGVDVDARIRVSEAFFTVAHALIQMMAAGYVGIRWLAMLATRRSLYYVQGNRPTRKGRIYR